MSLESQRQVAALLGLVPANQPTEEPEQEEGPPDFDGGVREPAPGPSDPAAEHGQFIAELIRGGQW